MMYLLQFQPRRVPGRLGLSQAPHQGNWLNVTEEHLTGSQAIARLRSFNPHMTQGPVTDGSYFYRVVPVEPLIEPVPPIPVALLLEATN